MKWERDLPRGVTDTYGKFRIGIRKDKYLKSLTYTIVSFLSDIKVTKILEDSVTYVDVSFFYLTIFELV